jgi:hypothetical protein
LASFWNFLDDFANIGEEAHIEHAIGFIEYEDFDGIEGAESLLHEVEESAGGGDEDIDAGFEGAGLWILSDAAVDDGDANAGGSTIDGEAISDLECEFAGAGEYEDAGGAVVGSAC